MNKNGELYWKVYALTTYERGNELLDLRMHSLLIVNQMKSDIDFISSNGEAYEISSYVEGLFDMNFHFSLFIEGRINQKYNTLINRAIEMTWNLTAYQTRNFEAYFTKNYKFIFMPINEIQVDMEGKLQTRVVYFLSSNGKLATSDDFTLLPKLNLMQDTFQKFDLSYRLLDGKDESVKSYDKLYYIDFSGYIDPINESSIKKTLLNTFRQTYKGKC